MIEQLLFITGSVVLFGIIFFKMIKSNDTQYISILVAEALGIALDFILIVLKGSQNIVIRLLIYIMSIVLPLAIIAFEYINIDVINFAQMLSAEFYLLTNNNKKAKETLLAILKKNPKNYKAHKKLAELYEKEGGARKAIEEYVKCIEINKKDYDSYYKVATLLNELGKKDESIEMLSNLLSKKPDYYNATITLGDLLIEKEKFKEAASIYIEALKYTPISFELNYNLGIVYTMLNDFKNAKEYYENAAEINSMLYMAKYNLAQIAMLYKDLNMAEEKFTESLEDADPSTQADIYFELAKINIIKGKKDIAIKYANIAIDMNSKKIAEKIKKEPLFISILSKISIPFNLEETEENKLSQKEIMSKEHLEDTTDITINLGKIDLDEQKKSENKLENLELKYKERENY